MDPESSKGLPPVSPSPKEVFSHSPDQPDVVHHDYYPNFLELLSQTLTLFVDNFFRLLVVQVLCILIIIISIVPVVLAVIGQAWLKLPIPVIAVAGLVYFIFLIIIFFWLQTVPVYFYSVIDQKHSLGHIFRVSFRKIMPYIWLNTISGLLIMGGSILFFIPGLILAIYSIFATFILMAEEQYGFTALHLSRHYLSGHFWGFLWRQILFTLIVVPCVLVIIFLQENESTAIVGQILGFIGNLVIYPISLIYIQQNYVALRWLKIDKQLVVPKKMSGLYIFLTILPIILIIVAIFLAFSSLVNLIPTIVPSIINQLPPTLLK